MTQALVAPKARAAPNEPASEATCPDCGATSINVQGLLDCPNCGF
ncbi:MAG: hypothetical protein QXG03_02605 [Halalkalicoccus sp.]